MVGVGFPENIRKIELKFYGNIEWSDISTDLEIKTQYLSLFALHEGVINGLDKKYTCRTICHFSDGKWIRLNDRNIPLCQTEGIRIEYYMRKKEQIRYDISKIVGFLPINDVIKWTQADSHINSFYEPYIQKYQFILQKIWRYGYLVCSMENCLQSNVDVIIQSDILAMDEESIFNDVVWDKSDLFSKKFRTLAADVFIIDGELRRQDIFISNVMFSKHTGFNIEFTIDDDDDDEAGHSVQICLTSMNTGNYNSCKRQYENKNHCQLESNIMYQASFERNTFTIAPLGFTADICKKEMHLKDNEYVYLMVYADGKRNNLEFNIHHFGLLGDIKKIKYQYMPMLSNEETETILQRKDKMKLFNSVAMKDLSTMETEIIDDFNFDMCLNYQSRFI